MITPMVMVMHNWKRRAQQEPIGRKAKRAILLWILFIAVVLIAGAWFTTAQIKRLDRKMKSIDKAVKQEIQERDHIISSQQDSLYMLYGENAALQEENTALQRSNYYLRRKVHRIDSLLSEEQEKNRYYEWRIWQYQTDILPIIPKSKLNNRYRSTEQEQQ